MPEPTESVKKAVGFIYVYYVGMNDRGNDDTSSSAEEELGPNEREITVFRAHPEGLKRIIYTVSDITELDRRHAELMVELLL